MEKPKPPLKFQVKITNRLNDGLYGRVIFHEKSYKMVIKSTNDNDCLKIPFNLLGIMNTQHLVRLSGISGAYTEFRLTILKSFKDIEIISSTIFEDIAENKKKYDRMEIFIN